MSIERQEEDLNFFICKNAKAVRIEKGFSFSQAADLIEKAGGKKVGTGYLWQLESGKRAWSSKMIERVAKAYGVPPFSLLLPSPGGEDAIELLRAWYEDGVRGVMQWISKRV